MAWGERARDFTGTEMTLPAEFIATSHKLRKTTFLIWSEEIPVLLKKWALAVSQFRANQEFASPDQ